jgi:EAL domain-containing protein (putative c-di-GMP-specific phosphodiesterase class I)
LLDIQQAKKQEALISQCFFIPVAERQGLAEVIPPVGASNQMLVASLLRHFLF